MTKPFIINRDALVHDRVRLTDKIDIPKHIDDIEAGINECFVNQGFQVVQHGRVIALRGTDVGRLSSAFKAGVYLGKYDDLTNTTRFLSKMVKAGHSYEPIRGENILFLFIGTGKPVYDHMVTYTVGRPTRIAGGQRANLPWGFEVPTELKGDSSKFFNAGLESVDYIIDLTKQSDGEMGQHQIQVARSLLPVGYVMPPFLMEFTEEALVKSVFKQRLWEKGAQGATVDIINDMWQCVLQLDQEKWETLLDYHGPHTDRWAKAMRTLRDKPVTFDEFTIELRKHLGLTLPDGFMNLTEEELRAEHEILRNTDIYDFVLNKFGKLPLNMWEKKQ